MEEEKTTISPEKEKSIKGRFSGVRKSRWIRFSIACIIYIAFAIWLDNYYILPGLLVLLDIYITRFIPWTFWKKSKNKATRKTMEWVDAILYALVAVYLINTFFFQNYKIPSSSLEKTLLVGDYLFVSKLSFGPRVPNTPLSFPLAQHTMPVINTKSYIEWPQWPYHRLKGLGQVERNDIVVFNFPAGDTVALKVQNPDYYTLCYNEGWETVNNNKAVFGDIVYRPVDRRENYVKRCIGMPGDNFEIRNNQVYIDGKPLKNPKEMQLNYYVMTSSPDIRLGESNFRELNVSEDDRFLVSGDRGYDNVLEYLGFPRNADMGFNPVYRLPLTQEALNKLKSYKFITKIVPEPGDFGGDTYPLGYYKKWTRADYGPVWIPERGAVLKLTQDNLPIYERVIRNYEGNDLQVKEDGKIYINGKETDTYQFKMNYYMMLGDNRDNSADSRSWGFVPEDHIVGKPLFVWLSIDKDRGWFDGRIRFDRFFKCVTKD
ncbi:signal peptidase I [Coprobacter fastidiosus]|uniref:Signal peptidase I n=1 Tax=Coprobacter fastidiosus NSB1 = JCM 33896 TaxID=1349822 RepID=A0A495WBH7_9BACT|nr:signal peptidase I [Coprobacter fastidiosus]ERM90359.1 signal peptidase [Coprobacter fastidiosus NSB1 = JCM 33896]RKT59032.1 signal peptidase I [Coprobacter fastidiosus NSB1 = JCM 33896]BEG62813.1 signal peptidase I [Coprobacter fastidiosus]